MTELKYLHKFRSLAGEGAKRVRDIIENSRLYFARATDFNDPFDCLPQHSLEANDEQIAGYLEGLVSQKEPGLLRAEVVRRAAEIAANPRSGPRSEMAPAVMKGLFEGMKRQLGVLSLSGRADHVLLWSHYADSHRGICLRYAADDFTEFFGEAQQVVYSQSRPALNLFTQTLEEQITNALMTKADFWAYEEEWRMFDFRNGPGLRSYPPELLKAVILGVATSAEDEAMVRSCVVGRRPEVQVFRSTVHPANFELMID